jgi:isoaspartyl peptidase/L-asparaginase-like protein (Ntn-hydrolase superfamily)
MDCEASQPEVTQQSRAQTDRRPLIVSTWPFGKPANERALEVIQGGGGTLDGVEQGIRLTEADAENASVGIGGTPNADGVVQLDACIMDGPGHKGGSVAALEGILHPISVARRVMEKTPHVMLAGEGARQFALAEGLEAGQLLTDPQRRKWREWKDAQQAQDAAGDSHTGHDTISLLVLGTDGQLAGGCSTSGLGFKLPGRVGDSPILGSGLYVDNEVGAAGATGVGENVMRYCASFLIVEMIRGGAHPEQACVDAIRRIARTDPRGFDLSINFVAIDRHGRYGAAGTGDGFAFSVTTPGYSEILRSAAVKG